MHISLLRFTRCARDGFGLAVDGKRGEGLGDCPLLRRGLSDRGGDALLSGHGEEGQEENSLLLRRVRFKLLPPLFPFLSVFAVNYRNVPAGKRWHLLWGLVETRHSIC